MNTASDDLPRHLRTLREKMLHATDYELAVNYFLEEFAGDVKFLNQSEPESAPHLVAVLAHVAGQALGRSLNLAEARVFFLHEHRFYHGNCAMAGHAILFFYFREANTGILAVIPGLRGAMEVARFHLPAGLVNPQAN